MTGSPFVRIVRSRVVTYGIALVWVMFAILGKLFPITPTHREIVARVFGEALSGPLIIFIGLGELCVAGWILSGVARRWCGWFQIAAVVTMNCIELLIASNILLWGKLNGLFAALFVLVVYSNLVAKPQRG
jgi:hypothetical protein